MYTYIYANMYIYLYVYMNIVRTVKSYDLARYAK